MKRIGWVLTSVVGVAAAAGIYNYNASPSTSPPSVYEQQTQQPDSSGLSNDDHYTNSDGNRVHSPARSRDGGVPDGATAECRDGTYSFSQHRQGTCSHHGGVQNWL